MKIYFAGNQSYPLQTDSIVSILLSKRLFSYHYLLQSSPSKKEYEYFMKLYMAGAENKHWQKALNQAKATSSLIFLLLHLKKHIGSEFFKSYDIKQKDISIHSGGFSALLKVQK